jgi:hypothetical protein
MKLKGAKIVPAVAFLVLSFLIPNLSRAQAGAMLSGAITDSAPVMWTLHVTVSR